MKKTKNNMKENKAIKRKVHAEPTGQKCGPTSPWMYVSIILGVLFILSLVLNGFMTTTKSDLSEKEAENKAEEFVELFGELEGVQLEVLSVEEQDGVFHIMIEFMGQTETLFMSSNGELFFLQALSLQELKEFQAQMDSMAQQEQQPQEPEFGGSVDELVDCLEENDFKIYGADWCPHCKNLVELFGEANIEGIYVECTEEQELCANEEITGYPTIKISGEQANVARSLTGFATATGCNA